MKKTITTKIFISIALIYSCNMYGIERGQFFEEFDLLPSKSMIKHKCARWEITDPVQRHYCEHIKAILYCALHEPAKSQLESAQEKFKNKIAQGDDCLVLAKHRFCQDQYKPDFMQTLKSLLDSNNPADIVKELAIFNKVMAKCDAEKERALRKTEAAIKSSVSDGKPAHAA